MRVYCNNVLLSPPDGIDAVIRCIAAWASDRSKGHIGSKSLLDGAQLSLKDGLQLFYVSTFGPGSSISFPALALATLTHFDRDILGRQWATEIGFRQTAPGGPIECSVCLGTRDNATGADGPIQIARPRIVEDMVELCSPAPNTPGLSIKELRTSDTGTFLQCADDPERTYVVIVISPALEGNYLVDVDRVRSLTTGLAQIFVIPESIFVIPESEDTCALEEALTPKYAVWSGAVNLILPVSLNRNLREASLPDFIVYSPELIEDILDDGRNPESEILSTVANRLELPMGAKFDSSEFSVMSSRQSSAVVQSCVAATIPTRPTLREAPLQPFAGTPPVIPRSFLRVALAIQPNRLAAPLRGRATLGALAVLLLIAVLTPGIYPLLVERSAARTATTPRSETASRPPMSPVVDFSSEVIIAPRTPADEQRQVSEADAKRAAREARQGQTEQTRFTVSPELARLAGSGGRERVANVPLAAATRPDVLTPVYATKLAIVPIAITANSADQIRKAQIELKRVGCFAGRPDGQLAKSTQDAVKNYWTRTGQAITDLNITNELIANVHQVQGRVCNPQGGPPIPVARPLQAAPRATVSTTLPARKDSNGQKIVGSRF
jgi:hypothetical protein